jgi:hypothetical protein
MRLFVRTIGAVLGGWCIVAGALRILDAHDVTYPLIGLDNARITVKWIDFTEKMGGPNQRKVLILGDSTVIAYPKDRRISDRLQQLLNADDPHGSLVFPFAAFGISSVEYYPFTDRMAALEPDAVVYGFNLMSLSERWRDRWARTEPMGWVPKGELLNAAREPLHWWGVTFDRLLMYAGLVRLELAEPWYRYRREQVRAGDGIRDLRVAMQARFENVAGPVAPLGLPNSPLPYAAGDSSRYNFDTLRTEYAAAFDGLDADYPPLQLFDEVLGTFSRREIPVVVYVVPVNMEYMRSLGVVDEDGLTHTVETISAIARANGAWFVDLHDLLPDAGFRDAAGHFAYEGSYDGPLMVARRLEPLLREGMARR